MDIQLDLTLIENGRFFSAITQVLYPRNWRLYQVNEQCSYPFVAVMVGFVNLETEGMSYQDQKHQADTMSSFCLTTS